MNEILPESGSAATDREPRRHTPIDGAREDFRNFVRVVAGTLPEGMTFDKWLKKMRVSNSHYFEQAVEVLVPTNFKSLACGCCREDPVCTDWVWQSPDDIEWKLRRDPCDVNIVHTSCGKSVGQVGSADVLI